MSEKLRNIIEDIASDFLKLALSKRPEICSCASCRNDMLAYILSRVPAKYVTTEKGALHTVIDQTRAEREAVIGRAVLDAMSKISKAPRHEAPPEDKDQAFDILLDKIYQDRHLDFRHYRKELLKRRIAIRINLNNLKTYSDYLRLLLQKPEEYDKLFETLCINVSEFYRDPEVWVTLRELFETLINAKQAAGEKIITIWSAGCANGEEPYSISILLKDLFAQKNIQGMDFRVYATDLDKKCLRLAEKAEYSKESLKNLEGRLLNQYFTKIGETYRVNDEIRKMVEIRNLDLIEQPGISNSDVVFCRNVFIYFNRSLQEQLLMKFYKALRPDGYLVKGKSEILITEAQQIFEAIDLNARIYRRKEVTN